MTPTESSQRIECIGEIRKNGASLYILADREMKEEKIIEEGDKIIYQIVGIVKSTKNQLKAQKLEKPPELHSKGQSEHGPEGNQTLCVVRGSQVAFCAFNDYFRVSDDIPLDETDFCKVF